MGKAAVYAATGIPVHLLIDRGESTVTVFSNPDEHAARYRDTHTGRFGQSIAIPDPVGIVLQTDEPKDYVR